VLGETIAVTFVEQLLCAGLRGCPAVTRRP
jgi:hypothetical protein